MDDPHFEFADPEFGFAATFEDGEDNNAHGHVTIVDGNLPNGRMVVDLPGESFGYTMGSATRFLCHIIQIEKNRQASRTEK